MVQGSKQQSLANLLVFVVHIAEKFLISTAASRDFEHSMLRVVQTMHNLNAFLWRKPRFPSDQTIKTLKDVCIEFGEHFMRCREHARIHEILLWRVTGKVHKMQHPPAMAQIMNPSHVACYLEESLVGTTVRVWKQSMYGRYEQMIQHRVLLKRLCGLMLRFEQ